MDFAKTAERLRKRALTYPETYEEAPWGDRVVKVRGKIFFFAGVHEGKLSLSVKLPRSGRKVLERSYARPTPYGLGKSGWVSASFERGAKIPEDDIGAWIDESYRALAPKKLIAQLSTDDQPKKSIANKSTTKQSIKSAATQIKKSKKRVMLLCHDPLRVERAERVLAAHGVSFTATDRVADVRARLDRLDALIVDVGRRQDEGLAIAAEIDASDRPILLFIVGVRDAPARKRAQSTATSADLYRAPPGDTEVAAAIAATLARY
jgi:predicted DNA-binding protein (MmcQ/YjbR family)